MQAIPHQKVDGVKRVSRVAAGKNCPFKERSTVIFGSRYAVASGCEAWQVAYAPHGIEGITRSFCVNAMDLRRELNKSNKFDLELKHHGYRAWRTRVIGAAITDFNALEEQGTHEIVHRAMITTGLRGATATHLLFRGRRIHRETMKRAVLVCKSKHLSLYWGRRRLGVYDSDADVRIVCVLPERREDVASERMSSGWE